jgi:multidrug efflux pump subunit AcrA (membrane-fusion protein)
MRQILPAGGVCALPVCAAVLFHGSCSPTAHPPPAGAAQQTPVVAVARVARQDLSRDMELTAQFRPNQEIDVYSKVSGYLNEVYVDVGDFVQRGQLVAEVEAPELSQELAHANASVKRNEVEIQRAQGELQRAEATYRLRKLSYDRLASVVKARPNLVAQQELDNAVSLYREAEAQVEVAKAALAATMEQVTVAKANASRIATLVGYLKVTAPFPGMITRRSVDAGAMIQAGTASATQAIPIVRLSQVDHLRLVLPVPESIASRIHVGTPVEIRLDSLNRIFQGRVARFSGQLSSSTRTMEAEVDVPNPDRALMPGMYGYATLRLDRRNDTLAVPVQAVTAHDTNPKVYAVNSWNKLEERLIVLGIETPHSMEVLSGIEEGDLVVVGNRANLRAGMEVEPKLVTAAGAGGRH